VFELADGNAARPGSIPLDRAPQLLRRDYVMNANDPYWLTHADERLTGFSPLYGEAETAPSPRTRMNHRLIAEVPAFSLEDAKRQIMSNRALTVELLRDDVVARCRARRTLAAACRILAEWNGTFSATARGAALWRETLAALPGEPWAEAFDPARPLETPRGLAPRPAKGADPVADAIEAALAALARAGVAPDAALGDVQFTEKAGRRFGMPGSNWREGSTNPSVWIGRNSTLLPAMERGEPIQPKTGLAAGGYAVNYGSSFVLVVAFEDGGPRAEAFLTYSASTDPRSPHFADQTERYAAGDAWRPVLFTREAIEADPALRVQELSGP
jgi:acyl-homoserine-lactone acylase